MVRNAYPIHNNLDNTNIIQDPSHCPTRILFDEPYFCSLSLKYNGLVFNRLCKHFLDNCAPLSSATSATSSSANTATWSKYNFFNFFNGCYEFLIISDPFLSLFIPHNRSTSHRLEYSLALTIINQAIFYQTTVVVRIKLKSKSNNSNSKSKSNILKYWFTYQTTHTVFSQI